MRLSSRSMHLRIDLPCPGENAALQVVKIVETFILLQPLHHITAARTAPAMDHHLFVARDLVYTRGDVALGISSDCKCVGDCEGGGLRSLQEGGNVL